MLRRRFSRYKQIVDSVDKHGGAGPIKDINKCLRAHVEDMLNSRKELEESVEAEGLCMQPSQQEKAYAMEYVGCTKKQFIEFVNTEYYLNAKSLIINSFETADVAGRARAAYYLFELLQFAKEGNDIKPKSKIALDVLLASFKNYGQFVKQDGDNYFLSKLGSNKRRSELDECDYQNIAGPNLVNKEATDLREYHFHERVFQACKMNLLDSFESGNGLDHVIKFYLPSVAFQFALRKGKLNEILSKKEIYQQYGINQYTYDLNSVLLEDGQLKNKLDNDKKNKLMPILQEELLAMGKLFSPALTRIIYSKFFEDRKLKLNYDQKRFLISLGLVIEADGLVVSQSEKVGGGLRILLKQNLLDEEKIKDNNKRKIAERFYSIDDSAKESLSEQDIINGKYSHLTPLNSARLVFDLYSVKLDQLKQAEEKLKKAIAGLKQTEKLTEQVKAKLQRLESLQEELNSLEEKIRTTTFLALFSGHKTKGQLNKEKEFLMTELESLKNYLVEYNYREFFPEKVGYRLNSLLRESRSKVDAAKNKIAVLNREIEKLIENLNNLELEFKRQEESIDERFRRKVEFPKIEY